jgi:hypothetical protein
MEKYGDGQKKMEGHCSTGQSSHRAVVPVEEEEEEEDSRIRPKKKENIAGNRRESEVSSPTDI